MKLFERHLFVTAFVIVIVFPLTIPCMVSATDSTPPAKEKLQVFLTDVLSIDISKYTVTTEGFGVSYPSELGGSVKQENGLIYYNSTTSMLSVQAIFRNGYIDWIYVKSLDRPIIYSQQPSTSANEETRTILERYETYAQKYGLATDHITLALNMLNGVSDAPPTSEPNQNFGNISNFKSIAETSGNMRMSASDSSIGFTYTFNGITLPNRALAFGFDEGNFDFTDTWGLYTVACSSAISKDEATNLALSTAKAYNLTLIGKDDVPFVVTPDFSNVTTEISLNMIPGQTFNTALNNALNYANSSKTRDPLGLYPFWQATIYFNETIGNIGGTQVGIWGDTKEIAYTNTYGHHGPGLSDTSTSQPTATVSQLASPESASTPLSEPSQTSLPVELIAITGVLVIAVVLAIGVTRSPR
jgi:hypothetical protein